MVRFVYLQLHNNLQINNIPIFISIHLNIMIITIPLFNLTTRCPVSPFEAKNGKMWPSGVT